MKSSAERLRGDSRRVERSTTVLRSHGRGAPAPRDQSAASSATTWSCARHELSLDKPATNCFHPGAAKPKTRSTSEKSQGPSGRPRWTGAGGTPRRRSAAHHRTEHFSDDPRGWLIQAGFSGRPRSRLPRATPRFRRGLAAGWLASRRVAQPLRRSRTDSSRRGAACSAKLCPCELARRGGSKCRPGSRSWSSDSSAVWRPACSASGGGIVVVPALIYGAGFSQHMATGTSLAVLLRRSASRRRSSTTAMERRHAGRGHPRGDDVRRRVARRVRCQPDRAQLRLMFGGFLTGSVSISCTARANASAGSRRTSRAARRPHRRAACARGVDRACAPRARARRPRCRRSLPVGTTTAPSPRAMASTVAPVRPRRLSSASVRPTAGLPRASGTGAARRGPAAARGPATRRRAPARRRGRARLGGERLDDRLRAGAHVAFEVGRRSARSATPNADEQRREQHAAPEAGRNGCVTATSGAPTRARSRAAASTTSARRGAAARSSVPRARAAARPRPSAAAEAPREPHDADRKGSASDAAPRR